MVADEVRNLAVKTSQSTEQIKANITNLNRATNTVEEELTRMTGLLEKTAEKVSHSQSSIRNVKSSVEMILNEAIKSINQPQSREPQLKRLALQLLKPQRRPTVFMTALLKTRKEQNESAQSAH